MKATAQNCPCNGCTKETGRGPDCHKKGCPRGWYEWDQQHQTEREAFAKYLREGREAEGVLIEAQIKNRPGRGVRK